MPSGSDSITAGAIYHFRYYASNARGEGIASSSTGVGATLNLDPPTGLEKGLKQSSSTTIYMQWNSITPVYTPADNIFGYRLYAINSTGSEYELIFDGKVSGMPSATFYSYNGLTPGEQYWFKVSALVYNGETQLSSTVSAYSCGSPTGLTAPTVGSVTLSQITIYYTAPNDTGGCTLTGYDVLLDSGSGFREVNLISNSVVRLGHQVFTYDITEFNGASSGSTVDIQVKAYNQDYSESSPSVSVLIAIVPNAPSTSVERVNEESDGSQLTIKFAALPTSAANGDSITSYSLEYRLGTSGSFTVYAGGEGAETLATKHTLTSTYVTRGNTYGFRYRARNSYGWGDYSTISYLTVATVPDAPPRPILDSQNSTHVVLKLAATSDNGGDGVTDYELWIVTGRANSSFERFQDYTYAEDGFRLEIDVSASRLTSGNFYRFKYLARNPVGPSDFSSILTVALADPPSTPGLPTAVPDTETSLVVDWTASSSTGSEAGDIIGYLLYMDDGLSGSYSLIYNGTFKVNVLTYNATGLTTGRNYKFRFHAVNYAGQSGYAEAAGYA